MVRFFWRCLVGAWVCLGFLSTPIAADIVTLSTADGKISLEGSLKSFDGEAYVLETEYGELTFKALGVICKGAACPDIGQYATDLVIGANGSPALRLVPDLVEHFAFTSGLVALRRETSAVRTELFVSDANRIPVARLETRRMSTKAAFAGLADNAVDFTVSLRLPKPGEQKAIQDAGKGRILSRDQSRIIALDALVVIVSSKNPVSALTREEIRSIFSGETRNWSVLGGPDLPIALHLPAPMSDVTALFDAVFLSDGENRLPLADGRAFLNGHDLADAVARDPLAIGFAAYSDLRNAKALALRGACGIRQVATDFAVQSGDYPLSRTIRIYSPPLPLPTMAEAFLTYLESPLAHETVRRAGFIPIDLQEMPLDRQQARISNAIAGAGDGVTLADLKGFVQQFAGAKRLSATFRFRDGSTQMDARSRRNIQTLAERIEVGDFDGRELLIAGFSDSQGSAAGNRKIALQRARLVRSALRKAAPRADPGRVRIRALGMGEISPIACNDDEAGRRINRRVEIWLR